MAIPQGARYT